MEQSKKILKVLCISELPVGISECNILTPPETIDSYIYKITHIPTGKYYWGKHKWNGQVYWHSGKCEELNKLWSTEINSFRYEVTEYDTYEKISKREDQILEQTFLRKDPLCWNKQRGINKKKDLNKDIIFVNNVYENVVNGKYNAVTCTKEQVKVIDFKQCRQTKVFTDKVLEIKDQIIANNGNTNKCNPLIILEDRLGDGKHLGINGYHTKCAFIKVKNATEIDVIFVPKEDHKKIPDSLLTRLGNTFNKKSKIIKSDIVKDDFIKELTEEFEEGYIHTDDMIRERVISELNFSSRQAATFLRHFKRMKKNHAAATQRKKSYSKISTKKLSNISKERSLIHTDKTIWVSSSTTLSLDRVYEAMEKDNTNSAHIIVHHPDPTAEEVWFNGREAKFIRLHKFSRSPLKIEYESISGWSDDDIVS